MDRRNRLIRFWQFLKIPPETIDACSVEYDLLCPFCKLEGRGDVHLVLLSDDSGFECTAVGHQYRSHRNADAHAGGYGGGQQGLAVTI